MNSYLALFFMSMLPVIELRGSVPVGIAQGLEPWLVWLVCVLGNLVPVPFIMLFIRAIFDWMEKRGGLLERIVIRLKTKADRAAQKVYKYELLGLCLLVAVPLPGTGAWTGSLVAALLQIRFKTAIPVIILGVCIAGVIMLVLSCGVDALFSLF